MNDEELLVRAGLAELVRTKPDLGRIDLDELVARRRPSRPGGAPVTRWLAIAAVAVLVAGLGIGLWFGVIRSGEPRVIDAEPAKPTNPLVGTTWMVTEIRGQEVVVDSSGQVPFLRFESESKISGSDPCNQLNGSYRLDGEQLSFSDLISTQMACQPYKQQGRYRTALDDVTRFTLHGSTLTLFNAADRPVLVFRAAADPSLPPSSTVQVRVRNDGDVDFDKVVVGFGKGRADYGAIAAGGVSDYQQAGQAYRYAYIRVTVDGRDLILQPKDYVGETPLSPGRYTYVLTAGVGSLDLRFEADQ